MTLYKMGKLAEILDMDKNLLNQWYKRGIIVPEEPPRRAGCAAKYSYINLCEIVLTERLANVGITLKVASEIARGTFKEIFDSDMEDVDLHVAVNLEDPSEFKVSDKKPDIDWDIYMVIGIHAIADSLGDWL